jgi:hypothetical protein
LVVLDFLYLIDAGDVTAALEFSREKVLDDGFDFNIYFLCRQAADLGIIMEAGAVGSKDIIALGGADAAYLIGGDAHADTGTADKDAAVVLAPDDSFGYHQSDIRIIDGVLGITAEVVIGVTSHGDDINDGWFQITAPVVVADSDMHRPDLLYQTF